MNPSSYAIHSELYSYVEALVSQCFDPVFNDRTERPVLIVDEAQVLHDEALFDLLKPHEHSGLSIMLISNRHRLAQTRAHMAASDDGILSRIDWQVEAEAPDPGDLCNICVEHNVSFPSIAPVVASGQGQSLRQFVRLLDTARIQAGDSGPIMDAHLRVAVSLISSPKEATRFLKLKRIAA